MILRVISLGAGVQSTTMALMAAHGEIVPMPDCAIFADTGDEPEYVYEHLRWLMSPNVLPFPVHVVTAGRKLSDDLRDSADPNSRRRIVAVPFFIRWIKNVLAAAGTVIGQTVERGIGRRQCTREFKIEPIAQFQRGLLGAKPRQRLPADTVECWIGISTDEIERQKPSKKRWQKNRHPLIELGMSRRDCEKWLRNHEYPVPGKSACIFCPFRRNSEWRDLRDNHRPDWQRAVEIDRLIRSGGTLRGMRGQQYVHEQLVPLDQADLSIPDAPLLGWANECEGMCGV